MSRRRDLIERIYERFNARDIDAVLALMRPDVVWPNGLEGGIVVGHGAVRDYWERQWSVIDPHVEPVGIADGTDGRTAVVAHQLVKTPAGDVLKDVIVLHRYGFDGDLVSSMEICEGVIDSPDVLAIRLAASDVVHRFMNSFDLKDWGTMTGTLAPAVRTDYAALRGEPAQMVSADDYVRRRATTLASLSTHHMMANPVVQLFGDAVAVRAGCLICRRQDNTRFDSHAFYNFALARPGERWVIIGITQKIFWNEGEPAIHAGTSR